MQPFAVQARRRPCAGCCWMSTGGAGKLASTAAIAVRVSRVAAATRPVIKAHTTQVAALRALRLHSLRPPSDSSSQLLISGNLQLLLLQPAPSPSRPTIPCENGGTNYSITMGDTPRRSLGKARANRKKALRQETTSSSSSTISNQATGTSMQVQQFLGWL